ncbi:MAG: chromosomal replication initiator protein DnaA [Candidatus Gracilibacteria bacterium]
MTNLKDMWVSVLTRIEPTMQRTNFVTWFQNTSLVEVKETSAGRVAVVGVPTAFARDWIIGKYRIKVLQAVQEVDGEIKDLEFDIVSAGGLDVSQISSRPEKKVRKVRNKPEINLGNGLRSKMLNNRYTLSSFIAGQENRLPHAAATAVANMPGGIYNPMYIYGGVGLGKTHLLQAIGNAILKDDPEKVVRYITAERFVSEVVESIKRGEMNRFKGHYRDVDVLLLDDVQFFAKKKSSEQEFFHTFDELYDSNKQIVLTSDRPPSELEDLDKRITTRFGMGMVTEILMPEFETRVAILQQKAAEAGMLIDPEVLEFIAANVTTSIRELEGVLRQVITEAQIDDRVPTVKSAVEVFRKLYRAKEIIGYDIEKKRLDRSIMTSQDVMEAVSCYYRVTVGELTGEVRKKEVMVPRQVCMYIIRHELDESFEKIGEDFGGRMHTTVMNACNRILKKLKKDSRLVRDINAIKKEIGL